MIIIYNLSNDRNCKNCSICLMFDLMIFLGTHQMQFGTGYGQCMSKKSREITLYNGLYFSLYSVCIYCNCSPRNIAQFNIISIFFISAKNYK